MEVFVNPLPSQPEISIGGSGLTSTSGTGYQWYYNGVPIENATGENYEPTQTGEYTVEVFDENGCSSFSEPYNWIAVGIDEREIVLELYPVPFESEFNLKSENQILAIEVMDVSGRVVSFQSINSNQITIDGSGWANGSYLLRIEMEHGQVLKRIVK